MSLKKETFCLAPWYSVTVNSYGKLAPCCEYKKQHYHFYQLEEYFHSDHIIKLRQDLLSGIKNSNCEKCWKTEENGGDSLRLITNRTLGTNSNFKIKDQIRNPLMSNIKSFDLQLGNLCNLKCVMCTPSRSSQLLAEINLNPVLKNNSKLNYSQKDFDWPKGDDFRQWCDKHLPNSIHIKFTGGEPFLIPWIKDVLEAIPDSQKQKCVLHFTTNLTIINETFFDVFRKFKEVWISVSVEGIGSTYEYLRFGHTWDALSDNIKKVLDKKISNLIFQVNHVVQTPSYHSILDMTDFFDRLRIKIHPILLIHPPQYHISSLTKSAKKNFLECTENYTGFNKDFISFVRSVSKEYIEQDEGLARECIERLAVLDKIRANNYESIIPQKNLGMC